MVTMAPSAANCYNNHNSSNNKKCVLLVELYIYIGPRAFQLTHSHNHYWERSPGGERGVERGSAQRSSLRGRERAIVNQTNIGTVSKATLGEVLRDGVECTWAFPSA